jgi:hypothetical protein
VVDLRTGKLFGAVDSTREGGLIGLPRRDGDEDDEDRESFNDRTKGGS